MDAIANTQQHSTSTTVGGRQLSAHTSTAEDQQIDPVVHRVRVSADQEIENVLYCTVDFVVTPNATGDGDSRERPMGWLS